MVHKSIARLPSQHFIRLPWQFTNTHLYSWSILLDGTLVHCKVTLPALLALLLWWSIITWWDTSPLQGNPPSISSGFPENSPIPIYTPGVLLLDGTLVHCKVTLPALLALLLLWSIITGWDTSPLQGYPSSISSGFPDNSPVPIYTPGWGQALWEKRVLLKNVTQCPSQVLNPGLSTHSPVHWPLGIREDILQSKFNRWFFRFCSNQPLSFSEYLRLNL